MTDHDLAVPTHWYQWLTILPLLVVMMLLEGLRQAVVRLQSLITDVARWVLA